MQPSTLGVYEAIYSRRLRMKASVLGVYSGMTPSTLGVHSRRACLVKDEPGSSRWDRRSRCRGTRWAPRACARPSTLSSCSAAGNPHPIAHATRTQSERHKPRASRSRLGALSAQIHTHTHTGASVPSEREWAMGSEMEKERDKNVEREREGGALAGRRRRARGHLLPYHARPRVPRFFGKRNGSRT